MINILICVNSNYLDIEQKTLHPLLEGSCITGQMVVGCENDDIIWALACI